MESYDQPGCASRWSDGASDARLTTRIQRRRCSILEYINIFGVPFTFLPHEGGEDGPPKPPLPKTAIKPALEKARFEIRWPNVIRIEHVYRPRLTLDWNRAEPLDLNASETAQVAELAPIVDGKPDVSKLTSIDLEALAREYRTQKIIFETARDVFDLMKPSWAGSRESLIAQLVKLVERFLQSDKLLITPPLFYQDDIARRLIVTLNMTKVVQHVWEAIRVENTERLEPVFDRDHPIRSTGNMATWYTGKPSNLTDRSHINMCVYDSTWEASEAFELDHNSLVDAWVKNDHLGFEVLYVYRGVVRKYRPDFIVRLRSGKMLVLETKGQPDEQSYSKRRALEQWIQTVNQHGGFGQWASDISHIPGEIRDVLATYSRASIGAANNTVIGRNVSRKRRC
jgi:type III restriction enzyme